MGKSWLTWTSASSSVRAQDQCVLLMNSDNKIQLNLNEIKLLCKSNSSAQTLHDDYVNNPLSCTCVAV